VTIESLLVERHVTNPCTGDAYDLDGYVSYVVLREM
jgi:hypothetical protein